MTESDDHPRPAHDRGAAEGQPDALIPVDPTDPDRPPTLPPRPGPTPRPTPVPPRPRPRPRPSPPIPPAPVPPVDGPVNDPGSEPTDPDSVRLFPDYFPDGLRTTIPTVVTALDEATVQFNPAGVVSGSGVAVNDARKRMSALLKSTAFTSIRQALFGATDVRPGVRDSLMKRELDVAGSELKAIEDTRGGFALSEATIRSALKRTPTEYTIDLPVGPPFRQTVPGYAGPDVTTTQVFRLSDYSEVVAGGAERSFQLPLLRGEILMAQRDHPAALGKYEQILALSGLTPARKRLAAIKAAYARVELGDKTYRSASRITSSLRKTAKAHYDAALALLTTHSVPTQHPDRVTITARVQRAKAQMDAGYNALGLRDSFVPVQRYSALRDLARTQMGVCRDALEAFEGDLIRAEDELGAQFDVEAERRAEATTAEIMAKQVENATFSEGEIQEKIDMIEAQRDFLILESAIAGGGKIIEAAAAFGVGAPSGTPSEKGSGVVGVLSTGAHFLAQNNELGHQLAMAKLEQQIAANQTAIARLQEQMSEDRIAYLERKARFLDNKRMNAEFLYQRAVFRERLVAHRLELCIFLAYLTERALAFFFGEPDKNHIGLAYVDHELGVGAGLDQLQSDFEDMISLEEAALDREPGSGFVERLSLRENYPLQFQQFLESTDGRMDFVYSLYKLSKDRPATHQCRLYHVGVEVKGLVPEGKLRGTLKHSGRFLVRDRLATLDPLQTTRLVPTDEQLEQALEVQRQQGTAAAAVGGVLFYTLPDDDVLDLSQSSEFVPPPPPTEFALSTFEGYAPTGLWSLQIENHRRLDITDVVLHFGIVNRESDPDDLRDTVLRLVDEYETELRDGDDFDRVDVFSLRQQFSDAYFALENGPATVELDAEAFDPELSDLQFKAVVVQTVDQEGDGLPGVGVVVRRNDFGFVRERVTGPGGFSENLDQPLEELEPDERFPLLGSWQVALADRAQFGQLDDLRLFLLYAYTET